MANAKWTVMVYMAAGDGADLDAHAVSDLQEMERANVGPDVNVVVQINRFWPAKPQRYHISREGTALVRGEIIENEPILDTKRTKKAMRGNGANMGDKKTLANFLVWAREHYPAERYFLVLWGHAYGLGFGRDHGDPMTLPEIGEAIRAFRFEPKPDKTPVSLPKLDLLGANACAISYAEAAYELRTDVQYLVASEIAVPLVGWPYEAILGCLSRRTQEQPGWNMPPEMLGQLVADRYVAQFEGASSGEPVAMSVLNLDRADGLKDCVVGLANALVKVTEGVDAGAGQRRAEIRAAFLATASGDVRPLIDLLDLAERLEDVCVDLGELSPHASLTDLRTAATRLNRFLAPRKADAAQAAEEPRFIAFSPHNQELDGLHGIGIFAPFVTDERDLKRLGLDGETPMTGRAAYEKLALSAVKDNPWAPLVFDRLRSSLPADVLAGVDGSGAANRADRSAVLQMLASVDSAFDALDRRILATRSKVLNNVPVGGAAGGVGLEAAAINLLGKMQLVRHADVDKMLKDSVAIVPAARAVSASGTVQSTPSWSGLAIGTGEQVVETTAAFLRLEVVIASTERTVRRTLTNGTFGLGPGLGRDKDGLLGRDKDGLLGRDKDGLLGRDKDGLLGRDKDGLLGRDKDGLLGSSAGRTAEQTPGAAITGLFREVGEVLLGLEVAASEAETVAAKALLAPGGTHAFEALSNVTLAKTRLERAFRGLSEASAELRGTLRRVVAHPTYGIGPGPHDLTVADRKELARASGLNSTQLALL